MKIVSRHLNRLCLITLACAALAVLLPACATNPPMAATQHAQGEGELLIRRSANLGQAVVGVSIDGQPVGSINFNQDFRHPIPVGAHVVTVAPMPNREFSKPSATKLNVQPGQTYAFTAVRDDVNIVLR